MVVSPLRIHGGSDTEGRVFHGHARKYLVKKGDKCAADAAPDEDDRRCSCYRIDDVGAYIHLVKGDAGHGNAGSTACHSAKDDETDKNKIVRHNGGREAFGKEGDYAVCRNEV